MLYLSFIKKFIKTVALSFLVILPARAMDTENSVVYDLQKKRLCFLTDSCAELQGRLCSQDNPTNLRASLVVGNLQQALSLLNSSLQMTKTEYDLCSSLVNVIFCGLRSLSEQLVFGNPSFNVFAQNIVVALRDSFVERFSFQSPVVSSPAPEMGTPLRPIVQEGSDVKNFSADNKPDVFFNSPASEATSDYTSWSPLNSSFNGYASQLRRSY